MINRINKEILTHIHASYFHIYIMYIDRSFFEERYEEIHLLIFFQYIRTYNNLKKPLFILGVFYVNYKKSQRFFQ